MLRAYDAAPAGHHDEPIHCLLRMNARTPPTVAFLLMVCLLTACRKERDKPTWDIDVLVPLVRTTFTIRDLVADSLLETDAQGNVTLVYRSDLFTVDLDTLLLAPDTNFVYRYALPIADSLNFPPGLNLFGQNDVQRFDLNEVELRRLDLRSGQLVLRMDNRVNSAIIGSLALPGAVFSDGSSSITATVGAGTPSFPNHSTATRDLGGARFDLRGPTMNSVNTLQTILGAQLDPNGSGAWVTADDSLIISANYEGLVPQYARGYFGQRTEEFGPDTNQLSLFDSFVSGTLDLDVATLKLSVENGFGADLRIRMREFQAINTRTGSSIDLQHAIFQGPINVNRAIDAGSAPIPSHYQTTIDQGNSNIDLFLESLADRVAYALDLEINPLGDISNGNDFLYHESDLKAQLDLEVPLRLIMNELTLQTISTPDLPGSSEGHALRTGTLRFFATNGFPMSARLELELIDAAGSVVSVIPVQGTVAPGILGANGIVTQRTQTKLEAVIDAGTMDELYSGVRVRSRVAFTTSDQSQHLRILDRYALDMQVTLEANYLVNGDE